MLRQRCRLTCTRILSSSQLLHRAPRRSGRSGTVSACEKGARHAVRTAHRRRSSRPNENPQPLLTAERGIFVGHCRASPAGRGACTAGCIRRAVGATPASAQGALSFLAVAILRPSLRQSSCVVFIHPKHVHACADTATSFDAATPPIRDLRAQWSAASPAVSLAVAHGECPCLHCPPFKHSSTTNSCNRRQCCACLRCDGIGRANY